MQRPQIKIFNFIFVVILIWLCAQMYTIKQELSDADVVSDSVATEFEKLKLTVDELETKLDYQELTISDLESRIDDIESKLNIV